MRQVNTGKAGRRSKPKKTADMRMLSEVPPAPDYFCDSRAAIWRGAAEVMISASNLSDADLAVLETFSQAMHDYRHLTAILDDEGFIVTNVQGNRVQHPAVYLRKGAEQQINLAASALCLSPRGRFALKREGVVDDEESDAPVALKAVASF